MMDTLYRALLITLLLVSPAFAASSPQTQDVNMTKVGGTTLSAGNIVDSGNNAFRVSCVVGCTPVSSFTDASPFTAGVTVESNIGGVFNDGLSSVVSGSAAAARITSARGLHINLRNQSGTELGTGGSPLRVDPTGSTPQPISGTVTVSGAVTANQGGAPWTVRLQDGSTATLGAVTAGNALKTDASATTQPISGSVSFVGTPSLNFAQLGGTALTGANVVDGPNTAFRINCILGCVTSGFVDSAAFTIATSTGGAMMATFNDVAANLTAGKAGILRSTNDRMLFVNLGKLGGTALSGADVVDVGNAAFKVNCVTGCTPVSSFVDNAVFTESVTVESNIGGVYNDGLAAVTSGHAAAARITTNRAQHINLRNNAGTEIGTAGAPVRTDPTGSTIQPVSGTVTANLGTISGIAVDTSVNGILVAQNSVTAGQVGPLVQAAVTTAAPSYTTAKTSPLSLTTGGLLRVDNSGVTQPVSGTVSITANSAINLAQVGGTGVSGANVVDAGNTAFRVNCVVGCAFTAFTDNTAFTAGTSTVVNLGGVFNDAITNLTAGNAGALRLTTDRMLFTNLGKVGGTAIDTNSGNKSAGTQRVVLATDQPALANPLLMQPVGGGSSGSSECNLQSAATTNATNCKASAGTLYGYELVNTTATLYYLRLYNLATAPTCSSATGFIRSIPIPASASGAGLARDTIVGASYGTGIGFCLTAGGASTDNTNAVTGIYVSLSYK